MVVEIRVTGNGHWHGAEANVTSYSVNEDATALDPGDRTAGTGQIEFTVIEDKSPEGTILLQNDTVELRDGVNGVTEGFVNRQRTQNEITNITADSRLVKLNVRKVIPAYVGTLGGAFLAYLAACGITSGIVIDSAVSSIPVTLRGFDDDVWLRLNNLASVHNAEIALVSKNIVLRPIRTREVEFERDTDASWTVENSDLAQFVDVYYYNNEYHMDVLAYPFGGWTEEVEVFSVEAGQTIEHEVVLDASLTSVMQPTCVLFVEREYEGPTSVYSVIGSDGLPIQPAQWAAQGGSVTVSLSPDGSTLILKLVGASESKYSPYRIAMGAGPSDYYSSLRIMGTGVFSEEKVKRFTTGVSADRTANEVGTEIRIPEVSTPDQAVRVGMRAAQRYAGLSYKIDVTSTRTNRRGESGNLRYPTFDEFDADWDGETFNDFDTTWNSGETFDEFAEVQFARVRSDFENQAFGNVAGARRRWREAYFRLTDSRIGPEDTQYNAVRDTTFDDFDLTWTAANAEVLGYGEGGYGEGGYGGYTYASFALYDDQFEGKTFDDMALIPLWRNNG